MKYLTVKVSGRAKSGKTTLALKLYEFLQSQEIGTFVHFQDDSRSDSLPEKSDAAKEILKDTEIIVKTKRTGLYVNYVKE